MKTAATARVLFVDDEPLVVQALQRMLRRLSDEWDMVFVTSGQEALQAMQSESFGVIISDMQMPGMNGGVFLELFGEKYPDTCLVYRSPSPR